MAASSSIIEQRSLPDQSCRLLHLNWMVAKSAINGSSSVSPRFGWAMSNIILNWPQFFDTRMTVTTACNAAQAQDVRNNPLAIGDEPLRRPPSIGFRRSSSSRMRGAKGAYTNPSCTRRPLEVDSCPPLPLPSAQPENVLVKFVWKGFAHAASSLRRNSSRMACKAILSRTSWYPVASSTKPTMPTCASPRRRMRALSV